MAKTTAFPRVINIIGAGNVGVITAYQLTKFYDKQRKLHPGWGIPIPTIHIYDKNKHAAEGISEQIGAHLQADETLNEAAKGLHLTNMLLTFWQGGRRTGNDGVRKWLQRFSNRGLEHLLMAAQADAALDNTQFNHRTAEQTRLGTASIALWEEMMKDLDQKSPLIRQLSNYHMGFVRERDKSVPPKLTGDIDAEGHLSDPKGRFSISRLLEAAKGILKFEVNMTDDYIRETVRIFNEGKMDTIHVETQDLHTLGHGIFGISGDSISDKLRDSKPGCLLQDGGSVQSEVFSRELLKYMQQSQDFHVEFHGETEITNVKYADDKKSIVSLDSSIGPIEGDSFIFATGNMLGLLEKAHLRDGVPMIGICGVTQNIRPSKEFWEKLEKEKKGGGFPSAAIKSVTPGPNGGVVKCVITPMIEYEKNPDGTYKLVGGKPVEIDRYIRIGGQFAIQDLDKLKESGIELGHLTKIGHTLSPDLKRFADVALEREQSVMDDLWPGIMKSARDKGLEKGKTTDAEALEQWIQARPASPDHCGEVGKLVYNDGVTKESLSNGFSIMGRGSGGTSFAPIDAEIIAQQMCLRRGPEGVKINDARGNEIPNIALASDPSRFTDPKGQFKGVFSFNGRPIAGSLGKGETGRDAIEQRIIALVNSMKPSGQIQGADVIDMSLAPGELELGDRRDVGS